VVEVVEVAEELYDTAARREDLAGYLEERGAAAGLEGDQLAEAMEARVVADTDQGKPASEATAAPRRAVGAKRGRGRSAGRSRDRQLGR
jgi:colicin import membrane protein